VARHLRDANVTLPGGARLTVEAFQALGQVLGASTGSDALHYLLEDPFAGSELSDSFLHRAQSRLSFAEAPLYAALHEAYYAQEQVTRWSAQRIRGEFPGFDPAAAIYFDDMYVPREFSLDTARAIRGLRPWVTNEYEQDGLRASNGAVLDRLIALARGNA
jgi:hypothetical protein